MNDMLRKNEVNMRDTGDRKALLKGEWSEEVSEKDCGARVEELRAIDWMV